MAASTSDSGYLSTFLHQLASDVPKFLGVIVILLIGYFVARLISSILHKALTAAKLNQHLHAGKGGNIIQRAIPNPTKVIAAIAYWLVILFTLSVATSELGIPVLTKIVDGIYAYIPNVIAAVVIFLVAGAISALVATLVANTMGDTPTGKIAATAAPAMVMGLAVFMILNQLKIAPAIVTITYAGIVGTATLAFGLGGKDAASKMFLNLYEASLQQKDTVAADFKKGADNAKSRASDAKDSVQQQM